MGGGVRESVDAGALLMNGSDNKCPQSWVDFRKQRCSDAKRLTMDSEPVSVCVQEGVCACLKGRGIYRAHVHLYTHCSFSAAHPLAHSK